MARRSHDVIRYLRNSLSVHTLQAFLARLHPANTPQQSGQ